MQSSNANSGSDKGKLKHGLRLGFVPHIFSVFVTLMLILACVLFMYNVMSLTCNETEKDTVGYIENEGEAV